MARYAEMVTGDCQSGFRSGRGTTDNIFILRQIIGTSYEYKINLHVPFVNFKQFFDSIKRIKVYEILQRTEIPAKLVRLIKIIMEQSEGRIFLENNLSEKCSVFSGARQGDRYLVNSFL